MCKEYLEAWDFIKDQMQNFTFSHLVDEMAKNADIVEQALHHLEEIKNVESSKALECLKKLGENELKQDCLVEDLIVYDTIKQTLLKEQSLEKENAKYKQLEEEWGCPLEVIMKVLVENNPILVQNPITKSIQKIPNPYNFYVPKRYAFDIRCENFEDTYWKSNIWTTGGAFFYLKDYKKTWWLADKEKSE